MTKAGECGLSQHLAHHQPERNRGQDHRQDEAGDVALQRVMCMAVVVVSIVVAVAVVVRRAHGSTPIR
jgi:hypothetical protein